MRNPEVSVNIGQTHYSSEGFQVTATRENTKPKYGKATDSTAIAEALHVFVARENGTDVIEATNQPSEGALGSTRLAKPDAIAAMAHAHMGGDSHDRRVVRALGYNEKAAEKAAMSYVKRGPKEINNIAWAMEEKGVIYSTDIDEAINEARQPEKILANVTVRDKTGREQKFTGVESSNNTAKVAVDVKEEVVVDLTERFRKPSSSPELKIAA